MKLLKLIEQTKSKEEFSCNKTLTIRYDKIVDD